MSKLLLQNMPNAYKEVYEILKYVKGWERNAIAQDFYDLLESKMNKEYQYRYDYTKDFSEQKILHETRAILGYIYLKYWADKKEKKIIENKLKNDIIKEEQAKRIKYPPNDIFKSVKKESPKNTELIIIKEGFVKKIINMIKSIFNF